MQSKICIFTELPFILFPAVLFPFLNPVFELLNITMFPKSTVDFFTKSVKKIKESRLTDKQTVKSGGDYKWVFTFDNFLRCVHLTYMHLCIFKR